jgi:ectoine hydroxylase-related dioxygenase (phytanoyl-CoA dioxygenase family)
MKQPVATIDLNELKQTFDRDGAVILPDFFSAEELAEINCQLDAYAAEPATERTTEFLKKTYTDVQSWAPVENGISCFVELSNHPRLRLVTEELVGKEHQVHQSLVMLTRKGKAQAWHQDTASDKETEFIVNRLIYSRDTPRAAGALVFVPGSHRQGQIPPTWRRLLADARGISASCVRCCIPGGTRSCSEFCEFCPCSAWRCW